MLLINDIFWKSTHGRVGPPHAPKRFIGQVDLPLSDQGIKQARQLGRTLSDIAVATIFCSDLQRSLKTAEIIAAGQAVRLQVRRNLREIGLGEWEGLTFEEVRRRYPKEFQERGQDIAHYRPPRGESFADCSRRVVSVFEEILASRNGNVLIIGHAGVNRTILRHVLGIPLEHLFRIGQDYGCLNLICYTDSVCRLEVLNWVQRERQ
ncbi:MAG: histidine phosphatase family protein [Desulfobacterales bacterium]|nr:histidine phosphatase family protein [Desulfobacterales bacterium]